jgi:hypothetical protein
MLIVKGGISRNIDEKNLQVYINKGYKPIEIKKELKEKSKKATKE